MNFEAHNIEHFSTEHSDNAVRNTDSSSMSLLHREIVRYEDDLKYSLVPYTGLNRKMVSFQSNKSEPIYRLFKYKEGFSASLVDFFIKYLDIGGAILDPFSGTGTTSIVASSKSLPSTAIELLPIGHLIAKARNLILSGVSDDTIDTIVSWKENKPWEICENPHDLITMPITSGAYLEDAEYKIRQFITEANKQGDDSKTILMFALCSILESISYTRKDGQCLRWDYRSGRGVGKNVFNKGHIESFDSAISAKLADILDDIEHIKYQKRMGLYNSDIARPNLHTGSSLSVMQELPDEHYSAVITSPPYCNRYDYTRTYALELAVLGISATALVNMRQAMLSCTVENRAKDLLSMNGDWKQVIEYTKNHRILRKIRAYLWDLKACGKLNNNGIPRMVEGYFNDMACIIYECYRTLGRGGVVAMVNDNVRYAGIAIPVDLILSDIARSCGFSVDKIMVLPQSKGNSSQQMGRHGKSALRKCVYVWKKS